VTGPLPVAVSVKPRRRRPDSDVMLAQSMPLKGPLIDRYGRVHDDLRISVTDRCNLRCVYCMPEEGLSFLSKNELLTFDEITRLAQVAKSLGVSALRLTGGEPLVRKGLPSLIGRLAAVGFEDLAMTTNGTELAGVARELAAAGLRRVNVSCDSLRPERFAAIRRWGKLDVVLNAMTAAEEAGLTPLKVNVVLLRGHNDDEILDFATFARSTGRIVRFIEFMPLDAQGMWDRNRLVPGHEVFERISPVWPLAPFSELSGTAPAERLRFAGGIGEIGLISSVS
jgi:cyclic pyranopterin phosphate synthase